MSAVVKSPPNGVNDSVFFGDAPSSDQMATLSLLPAPKPSLRKSAVLLSGLTSSRKVLELIGQTTAETPLARSRRSRRTVVPWEDMPLTWQA